MTDRTLKALTLACAVVFACAAGMVIGAFAFSDDKTIDSRTVPTLATVTLAGNGMVYCPTDGTPPLVAPCLNPPPTTSAP